MDEQNGLSKALLQTRLPDLAQVHYYEELPSTNDLGKRLVADEPRLPALIYARSQTSGRGRNGKTWRSNEDSMTFSFLVDLNEISAGRSFVRSHFALSWGMAIANALNNLTQSANLFQVKWPNDVMASNRKVAGILIESIASHPSRAIVGIGINVAGDSKQLSVEGPDSARPVSIYEATGMSLSKVDILASLWKAFTKICNFDEKEWTDNFLGIDFLKSKSLSVQQGKKQYQGKYLGLGCNAEMRIQSDEGEVEINSGTVTNIF